MQARQVSGTAPGVSACKESTCSAGDLRSILGLGRSPGEGKGYPLQYSGLENSMDCMVHGVAKSQMWLSDFYFFHFWEDPLEEEMATHSSILAWEMQEEPGGLQPTGSQNSWINLSTEWQQAKVPDHLPQWRLFLRAHLQGTAGRWVSPTPSKTGSLWAGESFPPSHLLL